MSDYKNDYLTHIKECMDYIVDKEADRIDEAASLMHECVKSNHRIFFFGTGHSYILSQEVFARAGGYAQFVPILEDELCMNHAYKSTLIERTPEYAKVILGLYDFRKDDVIVMISHSGRNGLIIELALELKKRGLYIIAVTSLDASKNNTSRHPSGYRLYELADVILDTRSIDGDAYIKHNERISTGPTSTVLGSFMIQLVVTAFVEKELATDPNVPVFISSNVDEGDAWNEALFEAYKK